MAQEKGPATPPRDDEKPGEVAGEGLKPDGSDHRSDGPENQRTGSARGSLPSSEELARASSMYQFVQDGFHLKNSYEHSKKLTELVDVTYNPRTKQFIFMDTRGITTWYKDGIGHTVNRSMTFPKYQNKLLRNIVYTRKYNVYFCLAKDFSLKVLNKDFEETCNVNSDLSSVMFLVFNPVRDELITGGVKGTKVWQFRQVADEVWREIKPMANYKLLLKKELESVKGSWIKKVELNEQFQHMYCCSDTDVQCYDMDGKLLFSIEKAHTAQINGCKYSPQARLLVTCSNDHEVKVWSLNGGLINVFRGHSKPVTNVVLHPETSMLVLTSSLDGSIKIWSLDIMELIYSMVVSTEGIYWMGLTGEGQLWTATLHGLSLWTVNEVVSFYALARCRTTSLHIAHAEGKASRVVAVGEDSSVRLVSMKDQKNLSTVLPPPSVSPLTQVLSVTYNREFSLVYMLVNPNEIWVYTMKTDPACRTAVWDVMRLQERVRTRALTSLGDPATPSVGDKKFAPSQRTSSAHSKSFRVRSASAESPAGIDTASPCHSVLAVTAGIHYWLDQGFVCPRNRNLLLMGLEDGRILFMDAVNFGQKVCELQACKDAILEMRLDEPHSALIIKSHLREEDLFQFWSIPELQLKHEILVTTDVTGHARLDDKFYTGHYDGSVVVHDLAPMAYDVHAGLRHTGLSAGSVTEESGRRTLEHNGPIVGMAACASRSIFISCSSDAVIKVWDASKTLMTEISLSQRLSTATFLNTRGDLLIGYLNHLFAIDHTKVLPLSNRDTTSSDIFEIESDIYEDPAVKYEGAAANPDPLDLENYLVPFNLDLTQRFLAGDGSASSSNRSSDEDEDEEKESQASFAATEVYRSPAATPRKLSAVDMLVSKEVVDLQDIYENKELYSLRRRQSLRRQMSHASKAEAADFEFPRFGHSPGPSPTPTPPSTPSEASISELGSETETEEEEVEELAEEEPEPLFPAIEEKPAVSTPEPKPSAREEEVPRYGLSTMKIDSKALLSMRREAGSSAKGRASPLPQQVFVLELKTEKSKPSSARAPLKKKEKKANRLRVGQRSGQEELGSGQPIEGGENVSITTASKSKAADSTKSKRMEPKDLVSSREGKPAKDKTQQGAKVGVSTVQLGVPPPKLRGAFQGGEEQAGGRKPNGKREKKKKQPIFSGDRKVASQRRDAKETSDAGEGSGQVNDTSDDPLAEAVSDGNDKGLGAMAMFKAASKLQITQKYGPQQVRIAVAPSAELSTDQAVAEGTPAEEDNLSTKAEVPGAGDDGNRTISVEGEGEDIGEVADSEMTRPDSGEEDIFNDDGNESGQEEEDTLSKRRIKSAKENRVRFAIPEKRVKSATPRLAVQSLPGVAIDPDVNDDIASMHSLPRTETEAELVSIPGSGQSIFDEMDFERSPTPPNISVSVMSRTSTRVTSLREENRVGSGLSQFETDSPFFHIPSLRSAYSPMPTPSPLGMKMLDLGGRASVVTDIASNLLDADAVSEVATVNINRAIPFSAPPEGRRARPNTAERAREEQMRPLTAGDPRVTFPDDLPEDYGSMTEEEFQKHLNRVSTPADLSGYMKNDGLKFDGNWQDRMILRHKFLKLQKEQRARSAADRRQLLELRQRQRRKALLGHHFCSSEGPDGHQAQHYVTRSDPSLNSGQRLRAKSAPVRQTAARSQLKQETYSPPIQRKQAFVGSPDRWPTDQRQESRSSHRQESRLGQRPSSQANSRLGSRSGHRSSETPASQHMSSHHQSSHQGSGQKDQQRPHQDLSVDRPYRFRLNESPGRQTQLQQEVSAEDVMSRDASSGHLLVKKKQSARSIPSRPRRYVLITQPGSEPPVMTPSCLEEQLLAKRFPKMYRRWQQVAPPTVSEPQADGGPQPPPQRKNSLNSAFINRLPGNVDAGGTLF
ncbi:uncharacterized protein [Diadema antillarum]|uniref:uncharacterized protein n=1 Tax=Diadema antillarum TaxID=105358 RepID=UPI003A8C65D6